MKYYCTASAPTYHHVLLTLEPGQIYEFDDAQIEAAEAMVTAGVLRHLDELDLPEADVEHRRMRRLRIDGRDTGRRALNRRA